MILDVCLGEPLPQNWIDAIIISLFKGKGSKSVCWNYTGISLFQAVGKEFVNPLLNMLTRWSFHRKCLELPVALYEVFAHLSHAFDSQNRDVLWTILCKTEYPPIWPNSFTKRWNAVLSSMVLSRNPQPSTMEFTKVTFLFHIYFLFVCCHSYIWSPWLGSRCISAF